MFWSKRVESAQDDHSLFDAVRWPKKADPFAVPPIVQEGANYVSDREKVALLHRAVVDVHNANASDILA